LATIHATSFSLEVELEARLRLTRIVPIVACRADLSKGAGLGKVQRSGLGKVGSIGEANALHMELQITDVCQTKPTED